MKKKILLIACATLLAGVVIIEVTNPIVGDIVGGWLGGEAFFDGKPTHYWINAFRTDRSRDIGKILRMGGAAAVPVLAQMLHEPDEDLRTQALLALSLMDSPPTEAAPGLEAVLHGTEHPGNFYPAFALLYKLEKDRAVAVANEVLQTNGRIRSKRAALRMLSNVARDCPEASLAVRNACQHPEARIRLQAANGVWELEHDAELTVRTLMELLKTQDGQLCKEAVDSLLKIGRDGQVAIPVVTKELATKNLDVRFHASCALARMGSRDDQVVAVICEAIQEKEGKYREEAFNTLGYFGRAALPRLIQMMKSENPAARYAVAFRLVRMNVRDEAIVNVVRQALKEKDVAIRQSAAAAVRELGPRCKLEVSLLIELVRGLRPGERNYETIAALGALGPDAKEAVPFLLELLKESEYQKALPIFEALGKIGPSAIAAIPALTKLMEWEFKGYKKGGQIPGASINLIWEVDPFRRPAGASKEPEHGDAGSCVLAGEAILKIDPTNRSPLPIAEFFVGKTETGYSLRALNLLHSIPGGKEPAIRVAREMVRSPNIEARLEPAILLHKSNPKDPTLSKTVLEFIKAASGNDWLFFVAMTELGNDGEFAIPFLIQILQNRVAGNQESAAKALGEFGPRAKAATDCLADQVVDGPLTVSIAAEEALKKIDPTGAGEVIKKAEARLLKRSNQAKQEHAIPIVSGI